MRVCALASGDPAHIGGLTIRAAAIARRLGERVPRPRAAHDRHGRQLTGACQVPYVVINWLGVPPQGTCASTLGGAHAEACRLGPALYARARRTPGHRGTHRHCVPRAVQLGARRSARRGRVLYAQRLPDHRSAAGALDRHWPPASAGLLAPPCPAAAASIVRHAGRGDRLGHRGRPGETRQPPGRGSRCGDVLEQLVPDRGKPVVLRQVRAPGAAGSSVVARRRGAVLPAVAVAAADRAALHPPGFDPTRVYEGTDTRAAGLLIGAALAMLWPSSRAGRTTRKVGWLLDAPAAAGLVVIVLMTWRVGQYSPFLYQGGIVLLSLATAAAVAAAACPGSIVGAALGVPLLRWIGVRSYGIYLWHYPVIVLTSPANAPQDLPRVAAQVAATIVLAALSWRFVEEPIRRGAIARAWRRLRDRRLARPGVPRVAAAATAAGVLAIACTGMAGVGGIPAAPSTAALAGGSGGLSAVTPSVNGGGSASGAGQSRTGRQGK